MENRSNHILVGSVVMGALVAVVLFIIWLSNAGGDQDRKYDILFRQAVDGLAKGSAVTFSGVPVGQVDSINLMPRTPEFIRVRITIDEDTPVLVGTTATIKGVGFTGVSQIQLDPPDNDPRRRRVVREITCPEVNREAQCPYGVPIIPTKPGALGQVLESAPELLNRVSTLTARLTELLGDRNQASIAAILENVQVISRNLAERSDEIAATLAEARIAIRQTGDAVERMGALASTTDKTLQDVRPLIGDLRVTVRSADTSMKNLDAAIGDARPGLQAFSKQTIPEVGQLVRDLREMSDSLSAVSQRLNQQGAGGIIGGQKLPDYKPRKR
ncbi:MAG: phospholipid/cholesterol/gamma-HCH transport system substrate-binding protein [Sphingomonadales bacterium]|jgi:phospholipid/cholesterol/gamma-HCH transport system substrate-binding protein|nr:phospholipid/cholesterol/gamma-HCH transport system substrate-binding protein [Sphingomonadales bacterium]